MFKNFASLLTCARPEQGASLSRLGDDFQPIQTHQQLFIDVDMIKEVKSFKYLGIYIYIRLKNNTQTKNSENKISQLYMRSVVYIE